MRSVKDRKSTDEGGGEKLVNVKLIRRSRRGQATGNGKEIVIPKGCGPQHHGAKCNSALSTTKSILNRKILTNSNWVDAKICLCK
jgi:hypothetical protein